MSKCPTTLGRRQDDSVRTGTGGIGKRISDSVANVIPADQIQRAENPYRFCIPNELIPVFRVLRARQKDWRELIDAEDVVHLFYGLGRARFLTFDGRVLVDSIEWDGTGAYEVTEPKEAWAAVACGAITFQCPELQNLLSKRPSGTEECTKCRGIGLYPPDDPRIVCVCDGLGWIPAHET
jgi:hypothetical protein